MIHISISKQKICAIIVLILVIIASVLLYQQMWLSSDYQIIQSDYNIYMPGDTLITTPRMLYDICNAREAQSNDALFTQMSLHVYRLRDKDLQQAYIDILHQMQDARSNASQTVNLDIAHTHAIRAIKHYQRKMAAQILLCAILLAGSATVLMHPTDIHLKNPHLFMKLKTRIVKIFEPRPEDWL